MLSIDVALSVLGKGRKVDMSKRDERKSKSEDEDQK